MRFPDANRELPDANRELPDANRELPDANREPPDANRELPDANRELPSGIRELPLESAHPLRHAHFTAEQLRQLGGLALLEDAELGGMLAALLLDPLPGLCFAVDEGVMKLGLGQQRRGALDQS